MVYFVDILNNEYWVKVYVGEDEEKLKKVLAKHFNDHYDHSGEFRGKCFKKSGYAPFVWINTKHCKDKDIYPTLAHEAIHAVMDIFEHIGAKTEEEVLAHSVAAIIRGYNKLKKINKKKYASKKSKKTKKRI